MTRVTVHEYAAALRPRYRAARKGSKGKILDEFCRTTGMHRKAAIRLLRSGVKLKPVRSRGPLLHQSFPDSLHARLRTRGDTQLVEDMADMLVSRDDIDA